jgi:phytoene dehydrogenase-like protein
VRSETKRTLGRQINTPLDLERKIGLIGGDIFHGCLSMDQLFRPGPCSATPISGAGD